MITPTSSAQNRQHGFTLVELIVVIILVAIISSYAASRYIGVSSFSAGPLQDQAISIIRQVQLTRMQTNYADSECDPDLSTPSNPLSNMCQRTQLEVSPNCLGSVYACTNQNQDSASDHLAISASINSGQGLVTFDLLGNPLLALSSGVDITLHTAGGDAPLCINSQGYVSKGGCQ
ncbi:hypothetical protein BCU68_07260 [Vibrio sp. 10N.286.49.B3]|nr:hypothetical protein BCU68_07260 [Vibrio sp. 10N.286.49.B3]